MLYNYVYFLVLMDVTYPKGHGEGDALWSASDRPAQHVELHSYDKPGKQGYNKGDAAKHTDTHHKKQLFGQ